MKTEQALSAQKAVPMFPNMMPFSVDATLTLALMLAKSWGARVRGDGFSTSLRSPAGCKRELLFNYVLQEKKFKHKNILLN